ncbi:hypothetical protein BpHYR1_017745 [Brachionus plicatilis]|uniref:Uncharacterized protein n=1 Tax=Brachionus plicatilis TaxID=10195 RepID=A0A3M7S6B3_BRAPC|nr:hypothetical protein BpHYR1_017745 [Brachionus plicatilis]
MFTLEKIINQVLAILNKFRYQESAPRQIRHLSNYLVLSLGICPLDNIDNLYLSLAEAARIRLNQDKIFNKTKECCLIKRPLSQ